MNGYVQPTKESYNFNYFVRIRDIESDEIIDYWESKVIIESSKKNPYEDFWTLANKMRRKYLSKNPTHKYYIETSTYGIAGEEE